MTAIKGVQGLNFRDFGTAKQWEPDAAYAEASGAWPTIGLPSNQRAYESGIKNELAGESALDYITQREYAEGLQALRKSGDWDGKDYTTPKVSLLKHRFFASRKHDELLQQAKQQRIERIRFSSSDIDKSEADSWAFGSDDSAPTKRY
ncbi:hypothetical protein [Shewanella gaetbuli]